MTPQITFPPKSLALMHTVARAHSRNVLKSCGIEIGADYFTLRSSQVTALIAWADRDKYRKPKNANGSRCRYYHDMLQRRAKA